MNVFLILLLLLVTFVFIRYWIYPLYLYKEINKLPGPKRNFFLGNILDFPKETSQTIQVLSEFQRRYGAIRRTWIGPSICQVAIDNPPDLKTILSSSVNIKKAFTYEILEAWLGYSLLTSTGDFWRKERKLITPAFHYEQLLGYIPITISEVKRFCSLIEKKENESINICSPISFLTLDVIGLAAFGINLNAQGKNSSEYVTTIATLGDLFVKRIRNPWLLNERIYGFHPDSKRWNKCLKDLHNFTDKVIKNRKEETENKRTFKDFLDILIEADPPLNGEQIRAEVDTFMFEGHDTTAHGIIWTLYNIANHLEVQKKLHSEIDSIFSKKNEENTKELTHQDLKKMEYLSLVLEESHRLHPPVPFIARELTEEITLSTGHKIPPKTWVQINIISTHRNPEYFENPNEFIPEREEKRSKNRDPFSYIPFSAGARNCIGQQFALNEEKIIISYILRNFEIFPGNLKAEFVPRFILGAKDEFNPEKGVQLKFKKRNI